MTVPRAPHPPLRPPPIAPLILVEDNDEDYEIFRLALEAAGIDRPILRFEDGGPLLDYLFREGDYADPTTSPRPALVLLDLNLPDTDGREVLARLRARPNFPPTVIIVLSTSANPKDVRFCYEHGVNGYSIKPVDTDKLHAFARLLKDFWFTHTILPETA